MGGREVYGFDKRKAWRAALRYAFRFPLGLGILLLSVHFTGGAQAGGPAILSVLVLCYGMVLSEVGGAAAVVWAAQAMHLYGRPVRVELERRIPVVTRSLGFVRVKVEGSSERAWCFGMPRELARLEAGTEIEVLQDTRTEPRPKWLWLPFWTLSGAEERHPEEAGHEVFCQLAEVMRPLEEQIWKGREAVGKGSLLLGLAGVAVVLAATAAAIISENLAFIFGASAVFGAPLVLKIVHGFRRRRAVHAAVDRFDESFHEGSSEREAAIRMLGEEKWPTPAWAALRKALKA